MDARSGGNLFVRRIIDKNVRICNANIFVQLCRLLSDRTGTVHIMDTLNSAIKNCAYLRKEEAIAGSTETLHWKNYFCILSFSCACWDLPGNLIIGYFFFRRHSRIVLLI